MGADGPRDRESFTAALPVLVRSLLQERLQLAAHIEVRPEPIYALVRVRSDGSLGPQLRETKVDCSQPPASQTATAPRCGAVRLVPGASSGVGIGLDAISNLIISGTDRLVVDRTGLTGKFDVDLRWNPSLQSGDGATGGVDAVDLFTAVQEQLGLKLEPRVEPIDVLVIDHVERPTEN